MSSARVISAHNSRSGSQNGVPSRNYALVSTRPLPVLEIPVTLALLWFGPEANKSLVHWYDARRVFLTRLSNTARPIAVTSWFLPPQISRALMIPLLVCGLPKLVSTMLLLSAPILRMLMRQYEFWFTTILNFLGMVLFAIQIGPDMRLGYPFLTFMSIQVTICSDADVYTLAETARAGVLSSLCATALGLFALHQSVGLKKAPPSASRDWNLAQVNFMANVSLTLAVFVINKSYKRRQVFWAKSIAFVPLAVCRAKLSVRSRRLSPSPTVRLAPAPGSMMALVSQEASAQAARPDHDLVVTHKPARDTEIEDNGVMLSEATGGRRRSSCLLSVEKMAFRVVPLSCRLVDANNTLVPALSLKRPLTNVQFSILVALGAVGLSSAICSVILIVVANDHDRDTLVPIAIISLVSTIIFCGTYAVNYERAICRLLLHNFDFWFTMLQFLAATVCLADLLDWDFRCLNLISWVVWFLWILFTDALLPTYKRKLRFKKSYATIALSAILLNILIIAYSLVIDKRGVLRSRIVDIGTIRNFFTIVISTGTFMGYRLATLWLWTSRLVWRVGYCLEEELVLLRGAVEYRNPFFQANSRRSECRSYPRNVHNNSS